MEIFLILLACVVAEGFFAGSEIAIVSVNRVQLRHLIDKGSRRAKALSRALENPEWLLSTTLLGTNLATLTFNALATLFVLEHFGPDREYVTILVTWPLLLVFGEVLPKAFFQQFADRIATHLIFPLRIVSWVFAPGVFLLASLARGSARLVGLTSRKKTPFITREELELVFQASEQAKGSKDLIRRMVNRVFLFSDRTVREIMIPLAEVVSINEEATLEEASGELRRSGFSRAPVYSGRVFHIVGWINQYDVLLAGDRTRRIREMTRTVRFVPATITLDQLLYQMQREGERLAVVVDEYGSAIGIVTLEDVIEEVVGDIEDEYDLELPSFRRVDSHRIIVNARMPLSQLSEILQITLPLGDYETVGGYLLSKLSRVPRKGEEYRYRKLIFIVAEASERSIKEVEVIHP